MNPMHDRAKEHFPTVLLTLLSIVQALALELLWSHLDTAPYLYRADWTAVVYWIQVLATFVGLMLIWVVYASNVMRFRWVPTTMDSVTPFFIGLLQFMMIASLGPDAVGWWFILMSVIYATMNWAAHHTMRRARLDGDNELFFRDVSPATPRDFVAESAVVTVLALVGTYVLVFDAALELVAAAIAATAALLGWQFVQTAQFWTRSLAKQ